MKRILITGAAGYLGHSTGLYLLSKGFSVVGIDDYSTSLPPVRSPFEIIHQDLRSFPATLNKLAGMPRFDGILHFAARALVPESFLKPHEYFEVNFNATLTMLEVCRALGIPAFVYSSTCAVYGNPFQVPISEKCSLAPLSPYGESKYLAERLVEKYTSLGVFKGLSLRYFNPAGALRGSGFGECHNPETHLVPNVIAAAIGKKPVEIYGRDYPTPDGTCIRDFIHVEDLSRAHLNALENLHQENSPRFRVMNVGTGKGTSVLEVARTVENLLGKPLEIKWKDRRPGDPPKLVAEVSLFKDVFGWLPEKGLPELLKDQWDFQQSNHSSCY